MAIDIPADAECAMIPLKWLPVLQEIAHGPFLPIDFPLPIVVSKMVPDDEIWFAKTSKIVSMDGAIEIVKKEKISNEMFKTDDSKLTTGSGTDPQQLCAKSINSDESPDRSDSDSSTKMGHSGCQSTENSCC